MSDDATILDANGMKVCRLICVTGENNNKYYNMTQISDTEFRAEWGRVEGAQDSKIYPMSKWDSTIKSKTKASKKPKPYTPVTHLVAQEVVTDKNGKKTSMFHSERPDEVVKFVENLLKLAKESVKKNYVVDVKSVTKAQVDEAQAALDKISKLMKKGAKVQDINDQLLELYKIIPRKMKKVQHHLVMGMRDDADKTDTIKTNDDLNEAKKIFTEEQDALDVMAGQVAMNVSESNTSDKDSDDEHDILQVAGLDAYPCSPAEIEMIKKKMGPNAKQFKRALRVVNKKTEKNFNKFVESSKNKKTELLWHGSRNENWWSIFQQGLMIRPSNAVLTGAMFGHGVYFADKAQKSIGYTSLRGSYWAKGGQNTAMLALYEIHQGKQKEILNWKSEYSRLNESVMSKQGYDSVFAKGGADLRNNEYITYHTDQSTIRYLVEIG